MNKWFISDPHYGHKNIVKGLSEWSDAEKCRPFDTLEEMNNALVNNINDVVKEDDILYCLGDWSFGGKDNIYEFRKRLNVKTIHLILGNHDHHIEHNRPVPIKGGMFYKNSQELFTSVQHYLRTKVNSQSIVMSHYSMRTWDKAHHGTWMLYGHSHGTLEDYSKGDIKFKTMDVGLDTHPEFRPYSFEEIKEIMDQRVALTVDYHSPKTN